MLRSTFISSYLSLTTLTSGYALWQIAGAHSPLAWLGVLLTSFPITAAIGWLMLFRTHARTSAHFMGMNIAGAIGLGFSATEWYLHRAPLWAVLLAVSCWLGFLLYSYWYSTFGGRKASGVLAIGSPLPHFSLKTSEGATLTSAELTRQPSILIFHRGNWCPLCMAQIKELVARYKEIEALGVRVAFISPQPQGHTAKLAAKHQVDFDFLSDEGNAAARALGIDDANGLPLGMQVFGYDSDTVMPTVLITDANGILIWKHETDNYRVRPEPDIYLNVLHAHGIGEGQISSSDLAPQPL